LCRFEANEGPTLLHSGAQGLHARVWMVEDAGQDHATLRIDLADGEDGFPGNRTFRAHFRLSSPATLTVDLTATSDAATLVNLAHHGYWNLDGSTDVAGHRLTIAADAYLDVDDMMIPKGSPRAVAGTAYDFRKARPLSGAPPLDHNFCLAPARRDLTEVAILTGASGVRLRIATTEPGLQVYDGRHFAVPAGGGLEGRAYGPRAGIAFEPQIWPDAPNRPDFPSALLQPGETARQTTRFRFDHVGTP
ncbi:MAG: aldose epimerase family protein, partial [Albidovulum sp.]